jgi:hypothetical protein
MIELIKLEFLPNNQYMGPYIFIRIFCKFKEECAPLDPNTITCIVANVINYLILHVLC